jgi:hypothetical protein
MLPQPENEWEYDVAGRVERAVHALSSRGDNLSTLLHLRWQLDALMDVVRMVHLNSSELAALIAILAPTSAHAVLDEWDYDVCDRVADAVGVDRCSTRLQGLMRLQQLRSELLDLMERVKLTDLPVSELAAMLAVLAPANGRRLLADTVTKALRPILRLVDNIADDIADGGDAALQLVEQVAELPDDLAGCEL